MLEYEKRSEGNYTLGKAKYREENENWVKVMK